MILWEVNDRILLLFAFVLGKLWKPKQHCMRRWQEVKLKVRHCMLLHVNKIYWSVLLYDCFIYFILISYFFYLLLLKMKMMMKKEGDFWWTSTRKFIQRYGRKSMSYFFHCRSFTTNLFALVMTHTSVIIFHVRSWF